VKARRIDITPYVRCHHTGVVVYGTMAFTPYIARDLARKLLAAADRIDPRHEVKAPWDKETKT
jgi:hypothetical protein